MDKMEFTQAVKEKLGYYVYILKNPYDNKIFYIGKGKGNRIFNHINCALETTTINDKYELIKEIGPSKVLHFILRHNLSEEISFEIEAACIDLLGLDYLSNSVSGHSGWERGLKTIDEINQYYDAKEVAIEEPAIIININKLYRRFMNDYDLYNVTRHRWKIGIKRNLAQYAIASYKGLAREVYAIQGWTKCEDGRFEFYGEVASTEIRVKYLNQSLKIYKSQYPIRYTF